MRIFSKIALIFIFSFTISHANDRVDLDIRLEPKSKKNFYSLKLNLESKESVLFGDNTYKIVRSENELFVDEYYDTKLHSLSSKKSSLRYRKRFVNGKLEKDLIQFKTQKNKQKMEGMKEFKLELDSDEILTSLNDIKKYINKPKNQNSKFNNELKNYVSIYRLEQIFSATQYRDRFYLKDKDEKTIYTISFDEVIYSKDLLKKSYLVIEFEVNETIMATSNKISAKLVGDLNKFIKSLDKENILYKRVYDSKYDVGIKKLGIKPRNENIIETILVFLSLVFIIFLFIKSIFSRNFRQKDLLKQYETNN